MLDWVAKITYFLCYSMLYFSLNEGMDDGDNSVTVRLEVDTQANIFVDEG